MYRAALFKGPRIQRNLKSVGGPLGGTDSDSGIQPLAFRWTCANGHAVSPAQRMTFTYLVEHGSIVQHLSNLLGLRKKVLVIKVLKPISAQEIAEKNWTQKEVSQRSEDLIREALNDDTGW
jgi:hypothetical protein